MSIGPKQLKRLIRIVDLVKKKKYPTCNTICKELSYTTNDIHEQHDLSVGRHTILRDIKLLAETYKCPIRFNVEQQGYELTDPFWDFVYPVYLTETEMMAMQIGRRICENAFPEPLRGSILKTVDFLLNVANPDLLSCSFVKQMHFISAKTGAVDENVFTEVYHAWRGNLLLRILYKDSKDELKEREIEPHALFFRNNTWYIQAFCHYRHEKRSFMIHRIQKAECMEQSFTPDPEIYEHVDFGFVPIKNVVLRFHKSVHDDIFTNPFHENQEIIWDTDDPEYKTVKIPEVAEALLIPRILARQGKIMVVEPAALRRKVIKAAKEVISANKIPRRPSTCSQ